METRFQRLVCWCQTRRYPWTKRLLLFIAPVPIIVWILDWVGRATAAMVVLESIWKGFVWLGPWVLWTPVVGFIVLANWDRAWAKIRHPAFGVRPLCGDTLPWAGNPELLAKRQIAARLAVRNASSKPLGRCSVRLQDAFLLQAGHVLSGACMYPSICNARGESFLLRWADSDSTSSDRKYLDLPPDGTERIAEVLLLNVTTRSADFAAANPTDLENKLSGVANGWWKLRIKISAADGTHVDTEWVAACCDRDPGPITLDNWHPRGEAILRDQRRRNQATSSA